MKNLIQVVVTKYFKLIFKILKKKFTYMILSLTLIIKLLKF